MIPKIIHQIWLGDLPVPERYTSSWVSFCNKWNWEYKMWREPDIKTFKLKNLEFFEKAASYQEKSDIARYEILYRYGGVYCDADFIWLGHNLEEFIPINDPLIHYIGVNEFPSKSISIIGPPYTSNAFICAAPKHKILKECVESIPENCKSGSIHAFVRTGPRLLNKCIKEPIVILPYFYIFPKDFHKKTNTKNPKEFAKTSLVFTYNGTEYPHDCEECNL